jgi:MYXO-CTERM domain-containing protein
MAFADETHGYLIVDEGTSGGVFVTADGGETFTHVPSAKLPAKNWTGLFVLDRNVAFVSALGVGADKQVVAETADGGAHWTLQTVTTTDPAAGYVQLTKVVFTDATHGYAAGTEDETGTGNFVDTPALYKTTDGGSAWVAANAPRTGGKKVVALAFTDAATGVAATDGEDTAIYRTTDGGASWNPVHAAADAIAEVRFIDAMNGFAVTAKELLVTTDAGAHWTASGTELPTASLGGESFLGTRTGLLSSAGGVAPWIWRTVDGGASWQPEATPTGWTGAVACVAYASATTQFGASSTATETRPLKYAPSSPLDAGAGVPDAAPSLDAPTGPDAGSGDGEPKGGAQGCGCRAAGSRSVPTAMLLVAALGLVLRGRRKPRGAA